MGTVYLARARRGLDRLVVIKAIRAETLKVASTMDRFLQEARITARLVHPNIVEIHDLGQNDDSPYLVMEYVHGPSLAAVLEAKRPLPIPVALEIAIALCRALHFAHTFTDERGRLQRVIHRDLKPQNVLLSYKGQVKLIDFGIAKSDQSLLTTASRMLHGTPLYMSPEQAQSRPLDHRSDIFSLGVLLYEMLTGIRPFERDDILAVLNAIVNEDVPPPRREGIDEDLARAVSRAMRRDPEERYDTAAQMQFVLEQCLAVQRERGARVEDDLESLLRALFPDQRLHVPTPVDGYAAVSSPAPDQAPDLALAPTSASGQAAVTTDKVPGLAIVDDRSSPQLPAATWGRWRLVLAGVLAAGVAAGVWIGLSGRDPAPRVPTAGAGSTRSDAAAAGPMAKAGRDQRVVAVVAPDAASLRPDARRRRPPRRPRSETARVVKPPAPPARVEPPALPATLGVFRIRGVPPATIRHGAVAGRGTVALDLRERRGSVQIASFVTVRLTFRIGGKHLMVTIDSDPWSIAYPGGQTPKRVPVHDLALDARVRRVDLRRQGAGQLSLWLSYTPSS